MPKPETSVTSSLASVESCEEEEMVLKKRDNGEHCAASQYAVYKPCETCHGQYVRMKGLDVGTYLSRSTRLFSPTDHRVDWCRQLSRHSRSTQRCLKYTVGC